MRRLTTWILAIALTAVTAPARAHPGDQGDSLPRVPPGFSVTPYGHIGGAGSSLAFAPDGSGPLYVADNSGDRIVRIAATGPVGGAPTVFADGLGGPLGVLVTPDGTVYVSEVEGERDGPFGTRPYGRVLRLRDTDGDGDADERQVVLKDLPNGRHNTNGLAIGPDGMLYVANGNATDDGIEGGDAEAVPWSGAVVRVDAHATDVSLASLDPQEALVATGMRNVYDLAFSPVDPTLLLLPTNGTDDARPKEDEGPVGLEDSDDLLYATDVDDTRIVVDPETGVEHEEPIIDDFGFPSCLYNERARGDLEPYDNPNPQVLAEFGPCPVDTVPRPIATFGLHVSADGAAFQTSDAWGPAYRDDLFVAEFGNFFGDRVMGHRVVRVELDGRRVVRQSELVSGVLPVDVTFDASGALYVLDFSGDIYRVARVVDVPQVLEVKARSLQFVPAALTVPEGTTVRWINEDTLPHNVAGRAAARLDGTVDEGREIDSHTFGNGGRYEYTFDNPGTWAYVCSLHPSMLGSVTVAPAGS